MMYLAQTTLEVDTDVTYLYNGIEIYLTVPVKNSRTQMVVKADYAAKGRDARIYQVTLAAKEAITLKTI